MTEQKDIKKAPDLFGGRVSRRDFLKIGGAAGAALSLAGVAAAGYASGKDFDSYTGWEDIHEGGGQFFDRSGFEVDDPTYEVVGPTRRTNPHTETIFTRHGRLSGHVNAVVEELEWTTEDDLAELEEAVLARLQDEEVGDEELYAFYTEEGNEEKLGLDLLRQAKLVPQQRLDGAEYNDQWELAMIWGNAWGAVRPDRPDTPPEEWDFRDMREEPLEFQSDEKATELIKKVAHTFGATLVRVARLNPDWVYSQDVRGGEPGPFDVPEWWEYVIVVTTPHEWDQMYGNPTYGTSSDAYARSSIAGARLAAFIRGLGYPARLHSPRNGYDLVAPPICVDAGLAQQGRFGFSIAPEVGGNHRPAFVTTNLPMKADKPIDFGVVDFCKKCKICADQCPSKAISFDDEFNAVVRGYKKWQIDIERCYNFWGEVLGNGGCRVCLAVCPYSRKNNWTHSLARTLSANDPTGVVDSALIWMQQNFFEYPDVEDYRTPTYGGRNASYRDGPEWMRIEKWFKNIDADWD